MHYALILTDKIAFTCHNRTPRLDQFFGFELKTAILILFDCLLIRLTTVK